MRRIRVGKFEVILVTQDWFALDGGVLFSGIPREIWKQHSPPDRKNRIRLPINCFLIVTPERNILVDTSIGDIARWGESTISQFLMRQGMPLPKGLRKLGLIENDIDLVLYTHLHFDHAGGVVKLEEGGALTPALPHAVSIVHKGELDHVLAGPHPKTQSSYRRETTQGIAYLMEHKGFETFSEDTVEVVRGITMIRTPGHTLYHASVKIESEGETAFIAGALATTRWHAHPAYSIGNDTHPFDGAEQKIKLLTQAAEEGWTILLEHDEMVAAEVKKEGRGFAFHPKEPIALETEHGSKE